jgi:type IV fimbrial biogenesis protein FimT
LKQNGFTLLELMVSLAVGAIVLTVAVPNYSSFVRNSRQTATANELLGALVLARDLAVTRNTRVTVCSSNDGAACGAGKWAEGWIAFLDEDADGAVDGGEDIERVVKDVGALSFASDEFPDFVVYRPTGRAMTADITQNTGAFTLCDERGAAHARVVLIDMSGRPRVSDTLADGSTPSCP